MKRRLLLLAILCFSLFGLPLTSVSQSSDGSLVDPLTFSGTVGTRITSSWNNADLHYNSPFSATAFADITFNVYGISVPMNINLINVSSKQFSFSKPIATINFTPVWKKFTFYFGTSCMNFSNYTYNGINFDGVGLEYRGNKFRFGGFYGNFNHATTFYTELDDRSAIQYLSDSLLGMNNVAYTTFPQFTRKAYAAHMAIGSMRNYVDISLFHAKDNLESLPSEWYMFNVYSSGWVDTTLVARDSLVKGQENLALGLKGHFNFGKWAMFEANLGASLYTPDITRDEIVVEGDNNDAVLANKVLGGLRKSRLFNVRYGSEIRFAGDALLNLKLDPVNATFTYLFVQPDYTSLGAVGFNQNAQLFGTNISTSFFNRTAFLTLNGYLQRDNLDGEQMYTNQVGSYSVRWNNYFGDNVFLSVTYNGVSQKQLNGTAVVPEESRINRITHALDVSPSYSLSLDNEHTFDLNFNFLQNKNLNKKLEWLSYDVTTVGFGFGYDVYLTGPRLSVDANYEYSLSRSPGNDYNSHCLSGGTSYNFIKTKNMKLSGNARLSMAFNVDKTEEEMDDEEKKMLDYLASCVGKKVGVTKTNDISVSSRIGATLNYKDCHRASAYFSISNYSDNIIIGQHIAVNTDVRFMLDYTYSFASRLIKSKKSRK